MSVLQITAERTESLVEDAPLLSEMGLFTLHICCASCQLD